MTQPAGPPVMFRAGQVPSIGAFASRAAPATAGPKTLIADISEFQPNINDAAYLRWSRAVIVRGLYGDQHQDGAWYGGARRDALHAGGVQFLGIYAYLTAFQDAAAQAMALVHLLGPLRDGEIPICDLEEGSGDQSGRWNAWQQVILAAYPQLRRTPLGRPMLYAGSYFAATHNLHPDWLAAYQGSEPGAPPHLLWQFTDAYPVPGVGTCDASVYHGTTAELAALIRPAAPAPAPGPHPAPDRPQPAPAPAPKPAPEDEMPAGIIEVAADVRESRTWPAGTVKQIVLWSDWEGLQTSAPIVDLRIGHENSAVYDAGSVTFAGNTATYTIGNPADCNGCSFTRHDSGPATVAWHTNA